MSNLLKKVIAYFAWSKWELVRTVNIYSGTDRPIRQEAIYIKYRLRDNKPKTCNVKV